MTYEIGFAQAAERDLRDIYEYVAFELDEPQSAARLLHRFHEAAKGLVTFPNRNHLVDEELWKSRNTRYMVVGKYYMFYAVNDKDHLASILRVVYGGRDVFSQLERLLGIPTDAHKSTDTTPPRSVEELQSYL